MPKENENIHLFILEEEYKRNKAKQNDHGDVLGEALPPELIKKNNASVFQELERMHHNFETCQEPELVQIPEEPQQTDRSQISEIVGTTEDSKVLMILEKIKSEEKELLKEKQELLTMEKDLQNKVVEEIQKKRIDLNDLKSEISDIQDRCKALSEALGFTFVDDSA
ncbi:MAG TPA: hypothetical protein VLU95_03000 [Candidatus Acidoferrum sp.]|nr:hypothetical protein [Candidatus Acidoferrum sp.]